MDSSIRKRRVLLAISGSIAAYKAADIISQLVQRGCEVKTLVSQSGAQFVTPTVLETLSGNPVYSDLFGPGISGTEHIRLARWADLIVFAPASANLMARLALGLADDLMTTVSLASVSPWMIVPAMNTVMWKQPVTQEHVRTLKRRGATFVAPVEGVLACKEEGVGKLAPVDQIVQSILNHPVFRGANTAPVLPMGLDLSGMKLLITAGPTTSSIDAVRYLTNPSTGKMGAALAEEALSRGAEVHYVLGVDKGVVRPHVPAGAESRFHGVEVRTAEEMCAAALKALPKVQGVLATAAVLDYRIEKSETSKLRRGTEPVELRLIPSVDVLKTLKENAKADQWFVGFAAETDQVEAAGAAKLKNKDLDYIFANRIARLGEDLETGFSGENNGGVLMSRTGQAWPLEITSKRELARRIWDLLEADLKQKALPGEPLRIEVSKGGAVHESEHKAADPSNG